MDKGRMSWADISKGIGILMVMFAHNRFEMNYASRLCAGCHMPLFFILGGVILKVSTGYWSFLKRKFRGIMIPYCLLSMVYAYGYVISGNQSMVLITVKDTIFLRGTGTLWFLPAYFFAVSLTGAAVKYLPGKKFLFLFILLAVLTVLFNILSGEYFSKYYVLTRILYASVYVGMGHLLKNLFERNARRLNLLAVLLIPYGIMCTQEGIFKFDLHYASIDNPLLYLILGMTGSIGIICFSRFISNHAVLEYYGKNSLFYMGIHLPFAILLEGVFEGRMLHSYMYQIAGFLITLASCFILHFCYTNFIKNQPAKFF